MILALLVPLALGADPPRVEVGLGSAVPVDVGLRLTAHAPHGLRAHLDLGVLPGPYVRLINGVVVALGGYDEDTAALVEASLRSSLVLGARLGWRPWEARGLRLAAGYRLVALGGSTTGEEVVAAATGIHPPTLPWGTAREYEVHASLHQFVADVGWEWALDSHLMLRTGLGVMLTLAAPARIDPAYDPLLIDPGEPLVTEGEDWLSGQLTQWVHAPTLGIDLCWRP